MSIPKIMILGTFHMAGSQDLVSSKVDDLTSDKRQREIIELVNSIKKFNPTKVAVEYEYKNADKLNSKYESYVNGEIQLKIHEIHQIGFRLAEYLGHKRIYPVDWMEQGAAINSIGEVYEYTKKDQPQFLPLFESEDFKLEKDATVSDAYRFYNEKENIKKTHKSYVNMARIGLDNEYKGMGWLIWWYQRNLIIFARLAQLVEDSNERIFLLIGSGHIGILSNFLKESELFEVVDVTDYL